MFSLTRTVFAISPYPVFLRVLRRSKILSTKTHPDPSKPRWTPENVRHLYRTMSPKSRRDIKRWANQMYYKGYNRKPESAAKVRGRQLARLEMRARRLLTPGYVVSFVHFCAVNSHRYKHNATHGAQFGRFKYLSKLWRKEKPAFQEQQLKLLEKRRAAAEAELKRRKKKHAAAAATAAGSSAPSSAAASSASMLEKPKTKKGEEEQTTQFMANVLSKSTTKKNNSASSSAPRSTSPMGKSSKQKHK